MYKTIMKIDGMMCGMCEAHMNDLIRQNYNVKKVTSSAKKGESIVLSEEEINVDEAGKLIEEIGYKLLSAEQVLIENERKKGFFSFLHK
ncbi:MAG: heavy metal-associated domain-containing protein [Lachnospiraceae bacterium]|nr:heavy metal-associated domain-containing protein [Lachnospiraceae bacterium]